MAVVCTVARAITIRGQKTVDESIDILIESFSSLSNLQISPNMRGILIDYVANLDYAQIPSNVGVI